MKKPWACHNCHQTIRWYQRRSVIKKWHSLGEQRFKVHRMCEAKGY